jgi:hypothetical protein
MSNTVTLRVRNVNADKAHLYASGVIQEVNEYTGQIVPNPKWVTSDSICITTGDIQFPFRIIDRTRILGMSEYALKETAPRSEIFVVQGSKAGTTYTVTRSDSHWSCSCIGFGFHKDCKHVRECKNGLS